MRIALAAPPSANAANPHAVEVRASATPQAARTPRNAAAANMTPAISGTRRRVVAATSAESRRAMPPYASPTVNEWAWSSTRSPSRRTADILSQAATESPDPFVAAPRADNLNGNYWNSRGDARATGGSGVVTMDPRRMRRKLRKAARVRDWPRRTKIAVGAWIPAIVLALALFTGPNR